MLQEELEEWKKATKIIEKIEKRKKAIFELALDIENDYSCEEARKTGGLIHRIWEEAPHYRAMIKKLEQMKETLDAAYRRDKKEREGRTISTIPTTSIKVHCRRFNSQRFQMPVGP